MEILKTWIEEWLTTVGVDGATLQWLVHGMMVCLTATLALLAQAVYNIVDTA